MDLALTATYFPHCNLTFAIVFGCPLLVEEDILRRLSYAMAEAAHPLLMPGIFAELERARHIQIIEATVDELEKRIFELDFQSSKMEGMAGSESETRNQEKRAAWLDTTYLRNGLLSWNAQLAKISYHADELRDTVFKSSKAKETSTPRKAEIEDVSGSGFNQLNLRNESSNDWVNLTDEDVDGEELNFHKDGVPKSDSGRNSQKSQPVGKDSMVQPAPEAVKDQLRRVGHKINDRIKGIIDEYDDKIRDCTMRVDGMAMATQWVRRAFANNSTCRDTNITRPLVKRTLK